MVFCETCKINTSIMTSHTKSKKHLNGGKTPPKQNKLSDDPDYHKNYYINNNLKDKYKQKKHCNCCQKDIAIYNWSKHVQTEKHNKREKALEKPNRLVNLELIKDDANLIIEDANLDLSEDKSLPKKKETQFFISDPLTIKAEDLTDTDE